MTSWIRPRRESACGDDDCARGKLAPIAQADTGHAAVRNNQLVRLAFDHADRLGGEHRLARAGGRSFHRPPSWPSANAMSRNTGATLARWYRTRTDGPSGARKTTMIVALARMLLIALWRLVTTGEVPDGVELRPAA